MGRPLNKKYFGNRNTGTTGTTDNSIGGEGLANISYVNGTGKTDGVQTATISAPDLPGGVQAVATVTITLGNVAGYTITEKGSGYTTLPTITVAGGGTSYTFTAILTTTQENAIKMTAFLTGGSAVAVDIKKQVSGRRYKVTDGTRTGIVKLTGSLADAAGECSILATDAAAGTYFVTKLTAHKATLTRGTGTVYTDGAAVPWTFDTATATVCKIANG